MKLSKANRHKAVRTARQTKPTSETESRLMVLPRNRGSIPGKGSDLCTPIWDDNDIKIIIKEAGIRIAAEGGRCTQKVIN
jgi:hypothetical protein